MKILVAEDSNFQRMALQSLLQEWNYEVMFASNGLEAQAILQSDDAIRIAILDCVMPGIGGRDLCLWLRQHRAGYVYVILLSADREDGDILQGFEVGADDYITKPYKELELRARLKVGERIVRTQQELARARDALEYQATHDPMTRLLNRAAILDMLAREMARAKRQGRLLSVALLDLDHFKRVNDTFGHLTGDQTLREAGKRMAESLREYDGVGRYGGEEFLLVLPGCDAETAAGAAERVRQRMSESPILAKPAIIQTVSIGVAQWDPGQSATALIDGADGALYRAKNGGRNRVEIGALPCAAMPPVMPAKEVSATAC